MRLHELRPSPGSNKRPKRLGCGRGSGHGKTSTRGHKGQLARTGSRKRPGFEGGQMPLYRRIPKRGFTSRHHIAYSLVNIDTLDSHFENGAKVDGNALVEKGLIKNLSKPVKILGRGELAKKLSVEASLFSNKAKEMIEKAGGEIKKV